MVRRKKSCLEKYRGEFFVALIVTVLSLLVGGWLSYYSDKQAIFASLNITYDRVLDIQRQIEQIKKESPRERNAAICDLFREPKFLSLPNLSLEIMLKYPFGTKTGSFLKQYNDYAANSELIEKTCSDYVAKGKPWDFFSEPAQFDPQSFSDDFAIGISSTYISGRADAKLMEYGDFKELMQKQLKLLLESIDGTRSLLM